MSFDALLGGFLADDLAADPTTASAVGYPGFDDALPDLTAGGIAERAGREADWTARLAAVADAELDADQRIDRDLLLATLRRRQISRDEWADWRRYPDLYAAPVLSGVHVLLLHRLRPEPELARAAAARLDGAAGLLAAGRANLDPQLADPLLVRRALGQVRGALRWLDDGVGAPLADPAARRVVDDAAARAVPAFSAYADHLADLAERATGSYAFGEARYSALLREVEGLGYGAAGLAERGRTAYDELAAEMRRRARELAGDEDWRGLIARLDVDAPESPETMRAEYAEATEAARRFGYERELVSEPVGERCDVEPSPPFQREVIAVGFYIRPPALTDRRRGTFFVPYPPEGASAEQVRQRLATNSRSQIPTIAVHEAYPGHHWHLSWLADRCARPVRKVYGTSYFTEGWALYAEQTYREHGYFTDPRAELRQVDARLFRAARIVVDTALHVGEMTVDQAVQFMVTRASLSAETARAEVARYCAWPTQAASYLTGALEIDRMRQAWLAEHRGSLREFHDRLAGSGMLPLGLAERALAAPR